MKETLRDLKERRSCRAYLPEQIGEEELHAILEAGTYAPTGMGRQSPVIVAVQDPETRDALSRMNAAQAVGVDSCYIFRAKEVFETAEGKALLRKWAIPERYVGIGNCILGYGAPGGKKEAAPRKEGYIVRV